MASHVLVYLVAGAAVALPTMAFDYAEMRARKSDANSEQARRGTAFRLTVAGGVAALLFYFLMSALDLS